MADALTLPALAGQFLTAVIGGAVGGVFGTGFKWIEQRAERTRRRKAIATALLNDLRGLELNARQLREHDYAAKVAGFPGSRPGDLIKRVAASDDLHLFGPETVSRLLYLASLVTSLGEITALYSKLASGADHAMLNIRARAQNHFIANQASPMKAVLEREGGTVPVREPLDVAEGATLPPLGPPAFPEWTIPPDLRAGKQIWLNDAGRPMPEDKRVPGA